MSFLLRVEVRKAGPQWEGGVPEVPDHHDPTGRHRVGILVFDGMKLLDVSGPAEVFAEANLFGGKYDVVIVSPDGAAVSTSIGIELPVAGAAADIQQVDTVLVAGGDVFPTSPVSDELCSAARILAARTRRMASICTGAFVLAAAGLLGGRRATTHWKHTQLLARLYPNIDVQPDSIYVRDGSTYTSAGVSAGIDLALAMVEEDLGSDLARRVAQSLVIFMQRAGGQSQFSAALQGPAPRSSAIRGVTDLVKSDPAREYSVGILAELASMSVRQLTRVFQEELSTTPSKFVESIRFDAAKAALASGYSVTETAQRSGFGNSETLRRVFVGRIGVPPKVYQQRFATARRG
jgi:transcriptional regulator GlxA family with amidase domain